MMLLNFQDNIDQFKTFLMIKNTEMFDQEAVDILVDT